MKLRKTLHDVTSMCQLEKYLERGGGSVDGRFWLLEQFDYEETAEVELSGTYRSVSSENDKAIILFEPYSDTFGSLGPINEESLMYGAVKVASRKSL